MRKRRSVSARAMLALVAIAASGAVVVPGARADIARGDVAPVVSSPTLSATVFYPKALKVLAHEVVGTVHNEGGTTASVAVLDELGTRVRARHFGRQLTDEELRFTWDGRTDNERLLPEGRYRMQWTSTNDEGIESAPVLSDWIRLSHQHLIPRVWHKRFTAKATLEDDFSGRCSKVVSPGGRGWKGSVGYFSASECDGSAASQIAAGLHVVKLPRALDYSRVQLFGFGAESREHSHNRALLYWYRADHTLDSGYRGLGQHPHAFKARPRHPKEVIDGDGQIAWLVVTGGGARYDVRYFKVTLEYSVLSPR